ncbi:hypothetical protein QCA50_007327 [Cerrena zonata]|uniref:Uncharacterized protein n=1 Tax=Cerrena zonata TaxID=2478898 RepID=A0AAW0G7V9_9APHY
MSMSEGSNKLPLLSQPVHNWAPASQYARQAEMTREILGNIDPAKSRTYQREEQPITTTSVAPGERLIIPGRRKKPVPANQAPQYQHDLPHNTFTEIVTNARDMVEYNAYAKKRYKEKQALRSAQSSEDVNAIARSPVEAPSMQRSRSDHVVNLSQHHSHPRATTSGARPGLLSGANSDSDEGSDNDSPVSPPPLSFSPGIVETQVDTAPTPGPKSHRGRFSEPNVIRPKAMTSQNRPTTPPRAIPTSRNLTPRARHEEPILPPEPIPDPAPIPSLPPPTLRRMTQGPRSTPPALGMRRAPYSSNLETKAKSQLPIKQKPFRVPFARPPVGQAGPSSVAVEQAQTRVVAQPQLTKSHTVKAPSRPPVARPRSPSRSRSPSPAVDPDTSYGDITMDFDPEVLDEVMRQYD